MPLAYALIHMEAGTYGVSEALSFHIAGMAEDGDELPVLRSLANLQADPDFRAAAEGAVVALVQFDLPTRSVRLNISMDEALLSAVDRAAAAAGQSRSAFLSEAARRRIRAA
jgi:hypothetical protein